MTKSQLETFIGTFDQWVSLNNGMITLANDGRVYPSPEECQFYFDSSRYLMFVRYTFPYQYSEAHNDEFVPHGDKYLRLIQGGTTDKTVGRYHEVFSFEGITSFNRF